MSDPGQIAALRQRAFDLFCVGVRAADPAAAVHRVLSKDPVRSPARVLAIGKAACAMMAAALDHVDATHALVVTHYANVQPLAGVEVLGAGHPQPDANGLAAGRRVKALVADARAHEQILLLLSGGGSALLPTPVAGICLADKQASTDLMLKAGMAIQAINLVRQNLSELKGGGLAALASPAALRSLILSDVIGDDARAIASGPTADPLGDRSQAKQVLRDAGLWDRMPAAVRAVLNTPEVKQSRQVALNQIIGSNTQSLQAMAAASGGRILSASLTGDVEHAARQIARDMATNTAEEVLLWGGETTVTVTGAGKGGRNQELSLRVLNHMHSHPGPWVFLSAGSDGIDGPTDAAGGLVDSTFALTPSLHNALIANDAYHALANLGGLIRTGATGTNVADFQLFLKPSSFSLNNTNGVMK